jgi:UDP-N-acetylglucosamine--dolichyl-phosphate N-acetylglucosaminephosphotransferase
MLLPYLASSIALSFLATYLSTPHLISFMEAAGIVGVDVMKADGPRVADMGGATVVAGLLSGVFLYIGLRIFLSGGFPGLIYILASLSTTLIITLIGIFDVLTSLTGVSEGISGFERMKRRGLPPWLYFLIPLPAAVPLVAVNAGVSHMTLPLIGRIELGLLYPLLLIPLAVLCCSNATNFLAGFNGLEAGMGVVLHISLGLYALLHHREAAALLSLTFAAALLAFLKYNWYPARIFPGDLNYTIGAVCAATTIIGNMERFAVLCFTPWIIEALLKATSAFKAESYGVLQPDGTLKYTGEVRSLTHIVMRLGRRREWEVSLILIALEAVVCAASILITL